MSSEYHHFHPHHMCCLCPVKIPSLLPMSSQYTIHSAYVQSVPHLHHSYTNSAQYLKVMSCWYPIFTAYVQSQYNPSCPCPVSTTSVLPMSSKYIICAAHVPHLSCLCSGGGPSPQPISKQVPKAMFSQYHISTANVQLEYIFCHVQSVYHLYCPCPVRIQHLLPISSYNTISSQ